MFFGTLSPMWQNVRMTRLDASTRGASCEAGINNPCPCGAAFMLSWISDVPLARRECRHHARESLRRIRAAKDTAPCTQRGCS